MACGRHAAAEHEVFGERLARFELRRLARGARYEQAAARELVCEARGERRFAADDCQFDALALCEVRERRNVRRAQGNALRRVGDSGVAGRAEESHASRVTLECAAERVLAPARADDKRVHVLREISCVRSSEWVEKCAPMLSPGGGGCQGRSVKLSLRS